MPYQSTQTCRFYVNALEWGSSVGIIDDLDSIFRTLPVNTLNVLNVTASAGGLGNEIPFMGNPSSLQPRDFVAYLGHNFVQASGGEGEHVIGITDNMLGGGGLISQQNIINRGEIVSNDGLYHPPYNGFSIGSFSGDSSFNGIRIGASTPVNIGSIVVGSFFDMPHSPDLKLTMTREGVETKRIRTQNGASFSNTYSTKNPMWGQAGAWEIWSSSTYQKLTRSGRRIWNLSFTLNDSSIFPETSSLSRAEEGGGYSFNTNDYHDNTLLYDDNFYSQVIHRTNGGELAFLFQPDINDITQFAICRFDMSSFKFTQISNAFYRCNLKIREVW